MKKLIFLALMFVALTGLRAQEGKQPSGDKTPLDAGQVPAMIVERFNHEYPGISGNWSKDGDNYRVEFVDPMSHLGHIILYDRNGDVIRRESELDGPASPQTINEYLRKNFPGEQPGTWKVQDKDGVISYYSYHGSGLLRFDKDGNPVTTAISGQDQKVVPAKTTGRK